ncbi:uncharacterized protein EI90DRAFT_1835578 [Cantharellus anzutake]|uniref:uncharacterized protein n=1 Tax=Cantharellus anzutake TaxID=1750568 RepID=UPI0019057587|nr:uncharacterized protein EI90DRAFT_1835578 [Cantharellus anzutake]KAF8327264.1 hypothetical protein EI90DRAFT_1835578 [Cantharellus anzutake]
MPAQGSVLVLPPHYYTRRPSTGVLAPPYPHQHSPRRGVGTLRHSFAVSTPQDQVCSNIPLHYGVAIAPPHLPNPPFNPFSPVRTRQSHASCMGGGTPYQGADHLISVGTIMFLRVCILVDRTPSVYWVGVRFGDGAHPAVKAVSTIFPLPPCLDHADILTYLGSSCSLGTTVGCLHICLVCQGTVAQKT